MSEAKIAEQIEVAKKEMEDLESQLGKLGFSNLLAEYKFSQAVHVKSYSQIKFNILQYETIIKLITVFAASGDEKEFDNMNNEFNKLIINTREFINASRKILKKNIAEKNSNEEKQIH